MGRRRKHWGWGWEDEQPGHDEVRETARGLAAHLGFGEPEPERPVPLDAVDLPAPRLSPPASLAPICTQDAHARATHAYGRSYRDVVRGFRGQYPAPPDVVCAPADEEQLAEALAWCAREGAAAIPYGGGTSVVGGVEPPAGRPAVTLDLGRMDALLDVDPVSRAVRVQAGASGPRLEEQLRPHGLTMRFYPQSFELSTVGGWIATRAGGHDATLRTHIDDLVESVRAVTPAGVWESRRLPGSGAGPSPDRMLLGSEGILGVITSAWLRARPRPVHRASVPVRFAAGFLAGAEALRAIVQAGLNPENCRLIDPAEAKLTFAGDGTAALLVLGFESADHDVTPRLARALEICSELGGEHDGLPVQGGGAREGAVGAWREAFLRAPYLRDTFVAMGVVSETFETAITWDRLASLHADVTGAVEEALRTACGGGQVSCRITHAYPDGAAPYFTVLAPARRGEELEQWQQVKEAAGWALDAAGATITHHHAVGRDHRPWYDRQRPDPFAAALGAAKAVLDPAGVLNPGVLIG